MTDPVVNGNRGRQETVECEGGASVTEHGLEEVDDLGRVAEGPHVELESIHHCVQKGTSNVKENNGDYLLPTTGIFDVVDKVEKQIRCGMAWQTTKAFGQQQGVVDCEIINMSVIMAETTLSMVL